MPLCKGCSTFIRKGTHCSVCAKEDGLPGHTWEDVATNGTAVTQIQAKQITDAPYKCVRCTARYYSRDAAEGCCGGEVVKVGQ